MLQTIKGSNCRSDDFSGVGGQSYLLPGNMREFKTVGGKSSDTVAPYFNFHKNGKGYIAAIGWTGQWLMRTERLENGVSIKSKIEDTEFYLKPGEKIRTSSMTVMFYNASLRDSYNLWRRYIMEECSHTLARNGGKMPLCASIWGGTRSEEAIKKIRRFKELDIPIEYIWMDAGWSGPGTQPTYDEYTGDWFQRVGDWVVSKHVHPGGLKDVANTVHKCGYKYILWFEPERAKTFSEAVKEHPEYFIKNADNNVLLDFGREDAYLYIREKVFGIIEELKIDCYRQDCNFYPIISWRANDGEHRRGITEIKHINGLWRFFDEMLERFPNLIIDNCASGGRRLDIEMMKRSLPLWRSDEQCPADPTPESSQMQGINYAMYLPYTGTGCGRRYDTYDCRSAYSPGMTSNFAFCMSDVFGEDDAKNDWVRERFAEYLSIRRYFKGDIYPLTQPDEDTTSWCAVQWNVPETNEGMIQVFKRENAPYSEAVFELSGIDANKTYRFTDIDGGEWDECGETLLKEGLVVRIKEKRIAKIYTYKAI